MPKHLNTCRQVEDLVWNVTNAHPEYLKEYENLQFDFVSNYRARLHGAMGAADDFARSRLEQLEESMDKYVSEYSFAAGQMCKRDMETRVMMGAISAGEMDVASHTRAEMFESLATRKEIYSEAAKKLLAQHQLMEQFMSGKAPTPENDKELLDKYGLSQLITPEELAAQREKMFAKQDRVFAPDYVNHTPVMTAKGATLVLDAAWPKAQGIDLDNYKETLRSGRGDNWANDAFDNLIKGIYSENELMELRAAGKDPYDGVFINGKPLAEAVKSSTIYDPQAGDGQNLRCAVDLILDGSCTLSAARYEKQSDGTFQLGAAEPAEVKPRIDEKFSLLRAILRFFGLVDSKEERMQKITMNSIENEEAAERLSAALIAANSARAKNNYEKTVDDINRAFFEPNVANDFDYDGLACVGKNEMDVVLHGLNDPSTRAALASAYMLSEGMTLDRILSDDPQHSQIKAECGARLIEALTILDMDAYINKNIQTPEECNNDYASYVQRCKAEIADLFSDKLFPALHEAAREIPVFDVTDNRALEANYSKIKLIADASEKLYDSSKRLTRHEFNDNSRTKLDEAHRGLDDIKAMGVIAEHYENIGEIAGPVQARHINNRDISSRALYTRVAAENVMNCAKKNGNFDFALCSKDINSVKAANRDVRDVCYNLNTDGLMDTATMIAIGKQEVPPTLRAMANGSRFPSNEAAVKTVTQEIANSKSALDKKPLEKNSLFK